MSADFLQIVHLIRDARDRALRSVNVGLVNLYWNVGMHISRRLADAVWGDKSIDELAAFIQKEAPDLKGFDRRGLYRMRQFYDAYCSMPFVTSMMAQLELTNNQRDTIASSTMTQIPAVDITGTILCKVSWTHHLTLMARTQTFEEREFYLQQTIKERYTVRELERQISSSIYERTMLSRANVHPTAKRLPDELAQVFRDDYIFEFLGLPESHSESELQKGLVDQMRSAILELGKDFLFVGQEYKLQVGGSDFYIDLLFYHRGLQCLVAFELKADRFKPEHLGQLNFYLEALDRDVKHPNENPSIGILLCRDKDSQVVEYALSRSLSPTMVARYKMQLPDKELLQRKLQELFA